VRPAGPQARDGRASRHQRDGQGGIDVADLRIDRQADEVAVEDKGEKGEPDTELLEIAR
jgi:hypothetical protein